MRFKRRRKVNKQILLTQLFLVLLLFIGIGYSILNTNLGINGTVLLNKYESIAIFKTGREMNIKMKTLAGDENPSDAVTNNTIISFLRSDTKKQGLNDNNIVSTEASDKEIYMWYENGTIYWYSEADEIYFNSEDEEGIATGSVQNSFFRGMISLRDISSVSEIKTDNVVSMNLMFSNCNSLEDISALANWNVSNVKSYRYFLEKVKMTDVNALKDWNISNAENITGMFYRCTNLSDISELSNWNTSNITSIKDMFYANTNLRNVDSISNWNTSKVTDMSRMFYECTNLNDISGLSTWNTTNVTNMQSMFYKNTSLTNIDGTSSWDTSNVTNMSEMFSDNTSLTNIDGASTWNTSSVTDMHRMFKGCTNLTNINGASTWNTLNVTDMNRMFYGCTNLTNINGASSWDVFKVENMKFMFGQGAAEIEAGKTMKIESVTPISNWNTTNVIDIDSMFKGNINLKGTFTIKGNPTSYLAAVQYVATSPGSGVTINYSKNTTNIDAIIATKSANGNVVKGVQID